MENRHAEEDPDDFERSPESMYVRRAVDGDSEAINWCVEKFSPWLSALAHRRMPEALRQKYSPEDLVQDTWLNVLPKLGKIEERGGRKTPVLMKFLMTTQINLQNALYRKLIQGKPMQSSEGTESRPNLLDELPDTLTGPITRVVRENQLESARKAIDAALETLEEYDRELVLLRMQGLSYKEITEVHGGNPNQLGVRFHRALKKLRDALPDELLDDYLNEK